MEVEAVCDEIMSQDFVNDYATKVGFTSVIAQPLAPEKLAKRLYKLAKKAKRLKKADVGVKNLLKSIEKKGACGIIILAGDASPIDIISHVPIVCEEHDIPYCYVPSKYDLAASMGLATPVPIVFISRDDQYGPLYDKCHTAVDALPLPL